MNTPDPAVMSLLVFLNVAPVGMYFLVLGLVNSHSRPFRISSRSDFVALTCVSIPFLLWPVPMLAAGQYWTILALGAAVAAIGFWRLAPRADAGWVIYNVSEGRWRRAWDAAAKAAGLSGNWDGKAWSDASGGLAIEYTTVTPLRNVSVHVHAGGAESRDHAVQVERRLDAQLERLEQLPSASGACMLTLGVALMVVPLWLLGRHSGDVAAAVARLFG